MSAIPSKSTNVKRYVKARLKELEQIEKVQVMKQRHRDELRPLDVKLTDLIVETRDRAAALHGGQIREGLRLVEMLWAERHDQLVARRFTREAGLKRKRKAADPLP